MLFTCKAVLPLTSDACSVFMSVFFFLVIGAASRPPAAGIPFCRALVAAGTLVQRNEEAKGLARDLGVPDFAHQLSRSGNTKVVKVAGEVLSLL